MGRNTRGKRDRTGPYKGSYERKSSGGGKRKAAREPCPKR